MKLRGPDYNMITWFIFRVLIFTIDFSIWQTILTFNLGSFPLIFKLSNFQKVSQLK